jgi:glycosyltransferase involved in cell wall biosynthesis
VARLLRIIDEMAIDLVHVHDPGSLNAAVACKIVRPHLKIVFTVHDTRIVTAYSAARCWLHRTFVNGHIAISHAVAQECHQMGLPGVQVVYNGVDLSRFTPREDVWSPNNGPLKLLQVARFEVFKKGQDLLLLALRECLNAELPVELTLAGMLIPEVQADFDQLRHQITELGLKGHVHLKVNDTQVSDWIDDYDLFVLPSRKEGFGLVLIEAMAAGVPVMASHLDGPAELIKPGVHGDLFPVDNPTAIAERIKAIMKNPTPLTQWRANGIERAKEFSIEAMVNNMSAFYQSVCFPQRHEALAS